MTDHHDPITSEIQLEELLSRPSDESVKLFSTLQGDILFLGAGGKIGPTLARMAKRACDQAGVQKEIYGVSLFDSNGQRKQLEEAGIRTLHGDLLDPDFLNSLPKVKNLFFLAGMKFGSEENLAMTWAVNTYLPAQVATCFKESAIVAFSTGCVYPLTPVASGGSLESDTPEPVGEYAQSCLGRERMFVYGSDRYGTKVCLVRLNYAAELRYGVLVDIALKVKNREPIDLFMGYFNVIWQGDMNDMVLRCLELCDNPARSINITGPEILSVREVARTFGRLFHVEPQFINEEAHTALLSNAGQAFHLLGHPRTTTEQMIGWITSWIDAGGRLLGKPTHYDVRDGKY